MLLFFLPFFYFWFPLRKVEFSCGRSHFPPRGDACGVLVTRFGVCRLCAARYGARAWTRLEAMSMYAVSVLKQVSTDLCADAWAVHPGIQQ